MQVAERRTEIAGRIEGLRRDIGAALLDKGAVPPDLRSQLGEASTDLAAVEAAEAELVRRQREQAQTEEIERRATLRNQIETAEAARLEAVGKAETAARDLAEALRNLLAISAEQMRDCTSYCGRPPLSANEAERRIAGLLSLVLGTVTGRQQGYVFGDISLRPTPYVTADQSWSDIEARHGAQEMESVFGKEPT
jgi:hypothetical protein